MGSCGSKPTEVRGPEPNRLREDNVVDFQVMRQMARNLKHNDLLNTEKKDDAMAMGAFRHQLGYWKGKFDVGNRTLQMKWSQALHRVDDEQGPDIADWYAHLLASRAEGVQHRKLATPASRERLSRGAVCCPLRGWVTAHRTVEPPP